MAVRPEFVAEPAAERRKGVMERAIETVASGLGNALGFAAETGILFVIFAVLWVAFGIGLIWSQGSVDAAWNWVRSLPLVLEGVVWVLFRPVMVGVWIWESTWPLVLRLALVISIAGWNLLVFLPKALVRP